MIFFISIFILIYILVFPLKIRIVFTNKELKIYLYSICFLRQDVFQALKEIQEVTIENIENNLISKDDLIYLNLFKKFKILKLDFVLSGFDENFEILSIISGFFYSLISYFDLYFYTRNIPFSYKINYTKIKEFNIEGIFTSSLGKIFLEYLKLRRIKYGRASN